MRTERLHASAGAEEVLIVLGGVPFTARVLPTHGEPVSGVKSSEPLVVTEEVGRPSGDARADSGARGTALVYLPVGSLIVGRDSGERHEATGRRLLIPLTQNGEPAVDREISPHG